LLDLITDNAMSSLPAISMICTPRSASLGTISVNGPQRANRHDMGAVAEALHDLHARIAREVAGSRRFDRGIHVR
jgi:hypothetical protein